MLDIADKVRLQVSTITTSDHKSQFGQFMTSARVAQFMASMFPPSPLKVCRLLDAGAGVGALSCAFLDRWKLKEFEFEVVEATAYEIDEKLRTHLSKHLSGYDGVMARISSGDYIELATADGLKSRGYTHAILNPPYKKINSGSAHRLALRKVGIETVNLYSAFVALALGEMELGGQLVAIIPRSFCNGPYYRPFRNFILEKAAIRHIHLFDSRSKAFKDDEVLQENIIIRLERGGRPGPVKITTSTDDSFSDLVANDHPFERIVFTNDPERFIHVPTSTAKTAIELALDVRFSLSELGLKVSTGPVVDFRLKDHLRDMPVEGSVPLLYPGHLSMTATIWPNPDLKKPNAIMRNEMTEKWLYPSGFYCAVRRFSSKEEKRRIIASVVDPSVFDGQPVIGFENHMNLFHENKNGLPELLARGLAIFLNSTAVDESFRRFNGHTQVNATDLKLMKYPSREVLLKFGAWAKNQIEITQEMVDEQLRDLTA